MDGALAQAKQNRATEFAVEPVTQTAGVALQCDGELTLEHLSWIFRPRKSSTVWVVRIVMNSVFFFWLLNQFVEMLHLCISVILYHIHSYTVYRSSFQILVDFGGICVSCPHAEWMLVPMAKPHLRFQRRIPDRYLWRSAPGSFRMVSEAYCSDDASLAACLPLRRNVTAIRSRKSIVVTDKYEKLEFFVTS